jgi:flagellin
MALNSHRQYNINNSSLGKNVEKLSSGYRINRAGDDAAGLAISEKMRAQIRGLNIAAKNSQDAISMVQTAEGALQTAHDILQRLRELAVQAASDTNQIEVDREALNAEFQQLVQEIDDTANKTKFNNMGLIDGTFTKKDAFIGEYDEEHNGSINYLGTFVVQSGANMLDELKINIKMMDWYSIAKSAVVAVQASGARKDGATFDGELNGYSGEDSMIDKVNVTANVAYEYDTGFIGNNGNDIGKAEDKLLVTLHTQKAASMAITVVNAAINIVSTQRSELGALQNRLEFKIQNLNISAENLQAAESRIRDADMAKMMTEFTKNNILFQASTAMLAQANALPQSVLQLLG